ncbi:hypothetical protein O181_036152 [Austropuccinia psidii MF-1]|uniref:Uncharacterized protein n=1 Tax=Austropuccinia psidii MF-1 TaxID=1389203 RepID=A0A9Q3H9M8_9BASI|nr:hypothetical protein [Austropuccinia psidii MF-1]
MEPFSLTTRNQQARNPPIKFFMDTYLAPTSHHDGCNCIYLSPPIFNIHLLLSTPNPIVSPLSCSFVYYLTANTSRSHCPRNWRAMATKQHINPLLFVTDCFTKIDTSVPNSDAYAAYSRNINLAPGQSHSGNDFALYQIMESNEETSQDSKVDEDNYIIGKDNSLGMDEVMSPKRSKASVKQCHIQIF